MFASLSLCRFFLEEKKAQAEKWALCSVFVLTFSEKERREGRKGGTER